MLNVILVNFNNSDDTINCVNSIVNENFFLDLEIKIFDNNSIETEKNKLDLFIKNKNDYLNNYTKDIDVFFSNDNLGFAYGNNYFIKKAKLYDYIWILNNDTLVNSDLLKEISVNLPKSKEVLFFDCYTFDNEFHDTGVHYVNLLTGQSKMAKKNYFDFEYVCGASFIIQNTEAMPLFDESYFLYYEDCDYGMLLQQKQFKYRRINDVHFLHKIGGSSNNKQNKINLILLRSQVLFMKRYSFCYFIYFFVKCMILISRRQIQPLKKFIYYSIKITKDSHFCKNI